MSLRLRSFLFASVSISNVGQVRVRRDQQRKIKSLFRCDLDMSYSCYSLLFFFTNTLYLLFNFPFAIVEDSCYFLIKLDAFSS